VFVVFMLGGIAGVLGLISFQLWRLAHPLAPLSDYFFTWSLLTPQQRTAIENHCRLSGETINPLFRSVRRDGISIILTVNSGYE
jgi:hypothetical protein